MMLGPGLGDTSPDSDLAKAAREAADAMKALHGFGKKPSPNGGRILPPLDHKARRR